MSWALRRLIRITGLLFALPRLLLAWLLGLFDRPDALALRLADQVPDHDPAATWRRWLFARRSTSMSLETALVALREVEADRRVKLVVLLLERTGLALVQAEALASALDRVKRAGKKVQVWIDDTGGPALVVGAAADRLDLSPEASLGYAGLRLRAPFVRDLLELVGVGVDLDHEGPYKSYSDTFTRRSMSDAHREMALDLATDLHDQIVGPLVTGRSLPRARVDALIDAAPMPHKAAVAERLADGVGWRDQVDERAKELLGLDRDVRATDPEALLARRRRRERVRAAFRDRPLVALVYLQGTIVPGEEGSGIPAHAAVELLDDLRDDASVRAVVIRIDSPGGHALASDDLWRAARRLDAEKPVVASLGRVAASGGYYLAVGCRRIVAHQATLTGSIGVVAGKLHLGPALERWGVRLDGPGVGARSGLFDPDRGFTDDERRAFRAELERLYRTFLERVAEGRRLEVAQVERLAQGRVYTGRRAHGLGLVDRLGDLKDALDEAAALAGLGDEPRVVRHQLAKRGLGNWLGGDRLLDPRALPPPLDALALASTLARAGPLAWCPWEVSGIR